MIKYTMYTLTSLLQFSGRCSNPCKMSFPIWLSYLYRLKKASIKWNRGCMPPDAPGSPGRIGAPMTAVVWAQTLTSHVKEPALGLT